MLHKFLDNFLFGLAFGCGFFVATALLRLLAGLLGSGAHVQVP